MTEMRRQHLCCSCGGFLFQASSLSVNGVMHLDCGVCDAAFKFYVQDNGRGVILSNVKQPPVAVLAECSGRKGLDVDV